MKYFDGQEVMVGDTAQIQDGLTGRVIGVLDTNQFSGEFPEGSLNKSTGAMIATEEMGWVLIERTQEEFILMKRL
jgi:hypothetical protein